MESIEEVGSVSSSPLSSYCTTFIDRRKLFWQCARAYASRRTHTCMHIQNSSIEKIQSHWNKRLGREYKTYYYIPSTCAVHTLRAAIVVVVDHFATSRKLIVQKSVYTRARQYLRRMLLCVRACVCVCLSRACLCVHMFNGLSVQTQTHRYSSASTTLSTMCVLDVVPQQTQLMRNDVVAVVRET